MNPGVQVMKMRITTDNGDGYRYAWIRLITYGDPHGRLRTIRSEVINFSNPFPQESTF